MHSTQVPLPRSPAEALAELSLDAWFGHDPGRA
jgi:hypothetical protein